MEKITKHKFNFHRQTSTLIKGWQFRTKIKYL